jgi:hypothetical protein
MAISEFALSRLIYWFLSMSAIHVINSWHHNTVHTSQMTELTEDDRARPNVTKRNETGDAITKRVLGER